MVAESSYGDTESVATSLSLSEDSYAEMMLMRSTATLGPSRSLARAARKQRGGLQIRPESLLKADYGRPPPRLAELAVVEAKRQAVSVLRASYRTVLERVVPGAFGKQEVWPPKALTSSMVSRAPARWDPHALRAYPKPAAETVRPTRQAYQMQVAPMPPPVRWFVSPAAPQGASGASAPKQAASPLASPLTTAQSSQSAPSLPRTSTQSVPSLPVIEASRQSASPHEDEDAGVQAYLKKIKEQNRRRREESVKHLRKLARGAGGGPFTLGQVYVEVEAISRHVPTPDCRALEGSLGADVLGQSTTSLRRRLPFAPGW